MNVFETLKNVSELSRKVDEAVEIKRAVEELQATIAELMKLLQGLECLLKKFKGGKCD